MYPLLFVFCYHEFAVVDFLLPIPIAALQLFGHALDAMDPKLRRRFFSYYVESCVLYSKKPSFNG